MQHTALQLILDAGLVVKGALLVLLFFSVVSWAIIIFKYRYLSVARRETSEFVTTLHSTRRADDIYSVAKRHRFSPISNIFKALYQNANRGRDEVRRSLRRHGDLESAKLENYLGFLATTGSSTPFIGLFGTVWGIMNSFRSIGATGAASLAVVAPGIAEALIATAMGLVAAIPAVIAYNYYLGMTRRLAVEIEDFSEEILAVVTESREQ
ncbi:MAG: MotA/TolQ/ExbB proton channel family protein [Nitrospirota bacterium]|jgi:biopolymer transport protein TolQ